MSTASMLDRPAPRVATPAIAQPMLPDIWHVHSFRRETKDTFTVELRQPGTDGQFRFLPGQFTMLYAFGVGEVPISISGDPARTDRLTHTIRMVGPTTRALGQLRRGGAVGVRGPFGTPWPVMESRGRDVVIVAGGIGLAPLRSAVYHILAHREEYDRVAILYGARTPADILYPRELERWRGRFDLQVYVTVDAAGSDWRGNVGLPTALIPRVQFDPDNTAVMLCGPEIMMRFTALEFVKRDVAGEQIFLSMERNMQCALGYCGHCQFGPTFICKDGPVFGYDRVARLLTTREI